MVYLIFFHIAKRLQPHGLLQHDLKMRVVKHLFSRLLLLDFNIVITSLLLSVAEVARNSKPFLFNLNFTEGKNQL